MVFKSDRTRILLNYNFKESKSIFPIYSKLNIYFRLIFPKLLIIAITKCNERNYTEKSIKIVLIQCE